MGLQVRPQMATGTYVGTGAAVVVQLGFKPVMMLLYNETDGDVFWFAIEGLADGKAMQVTNGDMTQVSLLASNGLTLTNQGFTAGTSLSESGKTIRYVAF